MCCLTYPETEQNELSLYVTRCCSTSLYRTSVCLQHKPFSRLLCRMVLCWILDISCLPVVRNIESDWKKLKLKGKADHYWGPSFPLSSYLLCSCRGTGAHSSTRLEPGWTPSHPPSHVYWGYSVLSCSFIFFTDSILFAIKELDNADIGCIGPSWLAGSKMSLCLFSFLWESQKLVLA